MVLVLQHLLLDQEPPIMAPVLDVIESKRECVL